MHPKTDEQRRRLAGAVSKSFLFRSLDQEQYDEVLDAIFERKVCVCTFYFKRDNHIVLEGVVDTWGPSQTWALENKMTCMLVYM